MKFIFRRNEKYFKRKLSHFLIHTNILLNTINRYMGEKELKNLLLGAHQVAKLQMQF